MSKNSLFTESVYSELIILCFVIIISYHYRRMSNKGELDNVEYNQVIICVFFSELESFQGIAIRSCYLYCIISQVFHY